MDVSGRLSSAMRACDPRPVRPLPAPRRRPRRERPSGRLPTPAETLSSPRTTLAIFASLAALRTAKAVRSTRPGCSVARGRPDGLSDLDRAVRAAGRVGAAGGPRNGSSGTPGPRRGPRVGRPSRLAARRRAAFAGSTRHVAALRVDGLRPARIYAGVQNDRPVGFLTLLVVLAAAARLLRGGAEITAAGKRAMASNAAGTATWHRRNPLLGARTDSPARRWGRALRHRSTLGRGPRVRDWPWHHPTGDHRQRHEFGGSSGAGCGSGGTGRGGCGGGELRRMSSRYGVRNRLAAEIAGFVAELPGLRFTEVIAESLPAGSRTGRPGGSCASACRSRAAARLSSAGQSR
jgi:hypothetical protein